MRRSWILQAAFLALAVLLAGFVWLTYNPDSELARRVAEAPGIGDAVDRFLEPYRDAKDRGATTPENAGDASAGRENAAPPEVERIVIQGSAQEALPFEWFVPGTTVHRRPDSDSEVLFVADNPVRFALEERRGEWAKIHIGTQEGWVLVNADTVATEPALGNQPAPVTAVTGRPPDPERLTRIRELLGSGLRVSELGPYTLYTDLPDGPLLAHLDRVADHHEAAYRRRYRRPLTGDAAAAVVLFNREASYRSYQADDAQLRGLRSSGHAGYGVVALYAGGSRTEDLAATLVHELTHLANRRGVGPALPPWLDEGLSDDLAGHRIAPDGSLLADTWRGRVTGSVGSVHWTGTAADLKQLEAHLRQDTLRPIDDLLALDWDAFVRAAEPRLHYAHAALWIRFLLDPDGPHGTAFRTFLTQTARGTPPTPEALRALLGNSWPQLDQDFRAWLRRQVARRAALPTAG